MAKSKFYVVWQGHKPGIYDNWPECQRQVNNFPAAKYKAFADRAEAERAYAGSYWAVVNQTPKTPRRTLPDLEKTGINLNSWAVDAACSGNPGPMEYRGVELATGREMFHIGPLAQGTNNIGEFLALVHALAMLQKLGKPKLPIYSDSRNAQQWIQAKTCRTKLARTANNGPIFELIRRAENWLSVNDVTNPIIKWETDQWGEIPADFGRK